MVDILILVEVNDMKTKSGDFVFLEMLWELQKNLFHLNGLMKMKEK